MRQPQDFTTRTLRNMPVVTAPGEIDVANADQLRDALSRASTHADVVPRGPTASTTARTDALHWLAGCSEVTVQRSAGWPGLGQCRGRKVTWLASICSRSSRRAARALATAGV
jgi:hypothetical protein